MNKNYAFPEIQKLLGPAKSILICLPQNATLDKVAAGLSLFLSVSKTERSASIISSQAMTVGFSHLVGVDRIAEKLAGEGLVMTINVPINEVEKVSTTDDGQHLNLVIMPKSGTAPITQNQILFSQPGQAVDLIITVGCQKLNDLGTLYQENMSLFTSKPIINLDRDPQNANFGRLNVIDEAASSLSEIVVAFLSGVTLPMDGDLATNLIQGLEEETNNLQDPRVTADTFEALALCLRAGGKRGMSFPAVETPKEKSPTPTDWLEPKIYKGSTLT